MYRKGWLQRECLGNGYTSAEHQTLENGLPLPLMSKEAESYAASACGT